MAKYNSRVQGLISDEDKLKLEEIKKQNPDISIRVILEDFIKDYCSTNPKGIKLKIKEIEKQLNEIQKQENLLVEKKAKLNIQLKACKDSLNHNLDSYIDTDLNKAVESIKSIINQNNITVFEDIEELSFINIAKHNKISIENLKNEVKKLFEK